MPKSILKKSKQSHAELPFTFYDEDLVHKNTLFRYPTQKEQKAMQMIFNDKERVKEYVVCGSHNEPLNYSCFTIQIPFQNYPIYTHILAHSSNGDLESATKEMLKRLALQWDVSLSMTYAIFSPKNNNYAQIYYAPDNNRKSMDTRELLEKKYRYFFHDERGDKDVEFLNHFFANERNVGKLTSICLFMQAAFTAPLRHLSLHPYANVKAELQKVSKPLPEEAEL
jgi:hypothetical protein